jgi:Protein of unknown function (DUF2793)
VDEPPRASPPASPALGSCYIVAPGATDAWAGKSGFVVAWTAGGWRFVSPAEGMRLFERTSGTWAAFRNGSWETGLVRGVSLVIGGQQVVGERRAAIDTPAGGSVVDTEGRLAIAAILDALRQHGLIEA